MSTEPTPHTVDINAWVEKSRHDPHLYSERQATEVVLASIGRSSTFGGKMFLKGGTLMGVVYKSPRQTADIDFTADFDPSDFLLKELNDDLNDEMKRTAAQLGYPDLVCRVQSLKKKPRPQGFDKMQFPAIEMKIAHAKRDTRPHERLKRGDCPTTLKVEVSFKEPVEAIELIQLGEDSTIHAYGFAELVAEKMRALLQQVKRDRSRCQDVYDIAFLVRDGIFEDNEKEYILKRLIEKSHVRDIHPDIDTMGQSGIKERAKEGWETLGLELSELPDFDTEFEIVESFYQSLPWDKASRPT
ncbi:nucleotidyl transferase AbiEii/AbiGii toxin family protein [Coraliomargarita sp. SDUM461004]|uniref:Nucleotidyl transferase AbiEii/AbiGii toxin family protein n=1 Tax=Thalassobacterium sedimentorum TaxID=3041258 RepID=A0ABU1AGQ0_9BACT|nr:nucleotidyl transferase AbiEii/AbiGii toxin family protein [Coraliomargarita sp. SDUM461004]MDQ8194007.1 nucleotidyl transferase AbiEii/AbiGii toxin family protein [Coraliomargarita sp. SDUM461004]